MVFVSHSSDNNSLCKTRPFTKIQKKHNISNIDMYYSIDQFHQIQLKTNSKKSSLN